MNPPSPYPIGRASARAEWGFLRGETPEKILEVLTKEHPKLFPFEIARAMEFGETAANVVRLAQVTPYASVRELVPESFDAPNDTVEVHVLATALLRSGVERPVSIIVRAGLDEPLSDVTARAIAYGPQVRTDESEGIVETYNEEVIGILWFPKERR